MSRTECAAESAVQRLRSRAARRDALCRLAVMATGATSAAFGLSGLSGCSSRNESGLRLTVAAYPQIDAVVKAALPAWQEKHPGVVVDVVSRQYADHHTAMTTALSTAVGLPDLMALESSYVGRFSSGYGLQDLAGAPYVGLALRERFVPFAFDQALNARGELVALPTDIGPGTMLLRQDILDRAGVAPESLAASWDAYVKAGFQIRKATGAKLLSNAQGLKDILIRSGLKPGQGLYFGPDSEVLVESDRFRRAFELAREVRSAGLDAKVGAWSNEWAEGFKRAQVATDLTGAWMVGQLAQWVAPSTAGLWRASQLPESTYVSYGGTSYAIPRRSEPARKDLAWSLMQHLTLDPQLQLQAFRDVDAFPALVQTLQAPFFDEPLPFLDGQPARRLWREAAQRISAIPTHKQNNFADEVVGTELDNVLERGKLIPRALADAAQVLRRRALR